VLGVKHNDLGSGCSFSLAIFSVYYDTSCLLSCPAYIYCFSPCYVYSIFLFLLGYVGCRLNSTRQLQSMKLLSMLYYTQSPGYHAYVGKVTKGHFEENVMISALGDDHSVSLQTRQYCVDRLQE
jgi:predicted exporter